MAAVAAIRASAAECNQVSQNADNGLQGGILALPKDVLRLLAVTCPPLARGVLLHVNKPIRRAVLEAASSAAESASSSESAGPPLRSFVGMGIEATCESPSLVAWSAKQGAPWSTRHFSKAVETAVDRADVEVLHELKAIGCPMDERTAYVVATRANPETSEKLLQWLDDACVEWRSPSFCWAAARDGNIDLLKMARERGCPWDWRTTSTAAYNDHWGLLEWAHEEGCPWDQTACANAAVRGNLPMLQFLRDNGCPWDYRTAAAARDRGHDSVLEWALENGCPDDYLFGDDE